MYQEHNKFLVLVLYVDDILLVCNDFDGLLKCVKASFFLNLTWKIWGLLSNILQFKLT
jgi:hypothetical protein